MHHHPPATRRTALAAFRDQLVADYGAASSTPRTYLWGADLLGQYLTLSHKTLAGFSPAVWEGFALWLSQQPDLAVLSRRTALRGAKAFCEWGATRQICPALTHEGWKQGKLPAREAIPSAPAPLDPFIADRLHRAIQQEADPYRTILLLARAQQLEAAELCGAPWLGAWAVLSASSILWVRGRKCRLRPEEVAALHSRDCPTYLKRIDLSPDSVQLLRAYAPMHPVHSPWLFPSTSDMTRSLAADTVRNVFEDVRAHCAVRVTLSQWSGR